MSFYHEKANVAVVFLLHQNESVLTRSAVKLYAPVKIKRIKTDAFIFAYCINQLS